ncbi:MAG TPA: hypothetical protein PK858_11115, partial [Saprospiraceae bacterium]|nr:hypothetical protein [Saprospiraceae bacterium]
MKKRLPLTSLLICAALLRLMAQGSNPAPFDMSTGGNFMLFSYFHCLQPSCSPPQYMAIGEEVTSAQGNFLGPIGADASYGTAAGNWYAEGNNGISYQGASNETRACFRLGLITTNRRDIAIEWKVWDINPQPNDNFVELQYRIGESGDFTNLTGDLYQQGTTPSGTIFTLTLPADANNQPLVQVRWIYYETGSGSRDRLSVDDITVSSSPLPVELTRFDAFARGQSVRLEWETATEQHNERFEVERSADGYHFSSLQSLPGAGSSREPQQYSLTDEQPLQGRSFYRLRQVDHDGSFSFSPVRAVQMGRHSSLQLLPTAVAEGLQVSLSEAAYTDQPWAILDAQGRSVLSGQWPADAQTISLTLNDL